MWQLLAQRADGDFADRDLRRLGTRVDDGGGDIVRGERPELFELVADQGVAAGERGIDEAGLDRGDSDAEQRDFMAQRVGEADLSPLAGDVHRLTGIRLPPGHRSDQHDVPGRSCAHAGNTARTA